MNPLQITWSPPFAGTGRPKILGTVLARPDGRLLCLVRQAFFGGENQGNTGSPRVETWLALEEPGARSYAPAFVRGTWPPRAVKGRQGPRWSEVSAGEVRMMVGAWANQGGSYYGEALRLSGYTLDDISPGAHPTWPTTIWDRRVILPDDERFPSARRATIGKAVAEALADRNRCPEDEVWRVDAVVLGLSPRDKG